VALEDSALVAYATMLDRDVAWLPVVQRKDDPRPVGCIRQERISNLIIQKIGQIEKERARAAT
jgi:predicted transcriptional regulator